MMEEKQMNDKQKRLLAKVRDRMDLHRAILRCQGFYDWMSKSEPSDIDEALETTTVEDSPPVLRPLPVENLLEGVDQEYAGAIIEEALPQDRARFRGYLTARPLGLGIITAVSNSMFISSIAR
jgi:hypothetical protein